jgi:hypothetical protein
MFKKIKKYIKHMSIDEKMTVLAAMVFVSVFIIVILIKK